MRKNKAKRICRACGGVTLVELIVSLALVGIFCAVLVALIQPFNAMFTRIQSRYEAQSVADTILEDMRGELLHAQTAIRFGSSSSAQASAVFASQGADATGGSVVEFLNEDGFVELIDAGIVPQTQLYRTNDASLGVAEAMAAGTVHQRYFAAFSNEGGLTSGLNYYYRDASGYRARAVSELHDEKFYMSHTVSLHFEAVFDKNEPTKVKALHVTVAVMNAAGDTVICTQDATIDLVDEPSWCTDSGAQVKPG